METELDMKQVQAMAAAMQMVMNGGAGAPEPQGVLSYKHLMDKYKAVSSTPTSVYGHGNGGLFSYPGMERPLISAMILPNLGLASRLPVKPSMSDNPVYGILTGVTGTEGSEPTGVCDDPPTAGLAKLCLHTFVFGRQARQSRTFDIDRFGRIVNRSDFTDFNLIGNPFAVDPANPNVPTIPGAAPAAVGRNEMAKIYFELATAWARDFAQELYSGNPTNNTAGGGRKYYYGLDILINTGYRDAVTQVACPAADSLVRSFGNGNISAATGTASTDIVRALTYMVRNLKYIAERAGLMPAEWVLAMRFGLFYELTESWPIAYSTYRNTVGLSNQTLFNDGRYISEFRDRLRNGNFLLIDGQEMPVVIDEAIAETEPVKGVFSSTIYIVPTTVLGGFPVTFWEYFNYNNVGDPGSAAEAGQMMAAPGTFFTSDNGRFMWVKKPPTNFCVQIEGKMEPRLILLTPHIAGRLTNIRYAPYIHERDSFTNAGYFVDGGNTNYNGIPGVGPSLLSPTS